MILKTVLLLGALIASGLGFAIFFGGPKPIPAMAAINAPFASVDFSDLPPLLNYRAADGAALAYRRYASAISFVKGSVVLVHGSSARSSSLHVLAKAFAKAGYDAYALDIRGHGASGPKGTIAYVGQLEDDLDAFVHAVPLAKPTTLAGFSSGGGFVLRVAGSPRQDAFQGYLLLSPFLGPDAPNYRPASGGWVSVGVPRIVALSILNRVGIRLLNDLEVIQFALNEQAKAMLTPAYSFGLASNFAPQSDYRANIRAVHQPVAVVAGTDDEAFRTDQLEGIFHAEGQHWPVTLVPGIGHIPLTLDPRATSAAVSAVLAMH